MLAPAFKEIVGESLQYMGVASSKKPKTVTKEANKLNVPNFMDVTSSKCQRQRPKESGLSLEVFGKGDKVVDQFPKARNSNFINTTHIYVAMQPVEEMPLPNLVGRSLRDAVETCSFFKVDCQTSGEGYVSEQSAADEARGVTLQLKPLSDKSDRQADQHLLQHLVSTNTTPTPNSKTETQRATTK